MTIILKKQLLCIYQIKRRKIWYKVSVGSCRFEGSSMNTSTKFGSEITIYYKGNIRNSGTSGSKKVWTGRWRYMRCLS